MVVGLHHLIAYLRVVEMAERLLARGFEEQHVRYWIALMWEVYKEFPTIRFALHSDLIPDPYKPRDFSYGPSDIRLSGGLL